MKERMKDVWARVWCHRAVYAGLAAAYGVGCLGWIDKEVVSQIATGCYVALVMQRH
jgi:hypothetical protein